MTPPLDICMSDEIPTQTDVEDPSTRGRQAIVVGVVGVHAEDLPLPGVCAMAGPRKVGRSTSADLVVNDPKVSRYHARLEPLPDGVLVTDLGSHNGTFVNAVRVQSRRMVARVGSTIRVGGALLLVVADADSFSGYPPRTVESMVGGPLITRVRASIRTLARSSAPILIEGETGTGKELAAGLLHHHSGRSGSLVTVNCPAIPKELIESELFGHVRGAFSGSRHSRRGLFRSASTGTLLLDEIGELTAGAQAKLLRVVEEKTVRPIGQDEAIPVDVRILAATNRRLETMVEQGAFRPDLFHRVAGLRLTMPPLKDRLEDIPLLCAHFLDDPSVTLAVTTMERLLLRPWPGNVRELRHTVLAAAAHARDNGRNHLLPEDIPDAQPKPTESAPATTGSDENVLRARIVTALQLRGGNVSQVARDLGMRRAGLYEAFARWGIDPASFR